MGLYLLIALGGAIGAVLRFGVFQYFSASFSSALPWGTLTVNVVGSLLMGFLATMFVTRWHLPVNLQYALLVGLLGVLQVPTLVLVQGGAELEAHFDVIDLEPEGGLQWVAVRPLDEDAGYEELRIGFRGNLLAGIRLLDGLGQTTTLAFSASEENAELADDTFRFIPPEGVDVLRDE